LGIPSLLDSIDTAFEGIVETGPEATRVSGAPVDAAIIVTTGCSVIEGTTPVFKTRDVEKEAEIAQEENEDQLVPGTQFSSITPLIEDARHAASVDKPTATRSTPLDKIRSEGTDETKGNEFVEVEVVQTVVSPAVSTFPLQSSDPKQKDYRMSQDRGANKWTFDSPRKEMVDFLAEQCERNIGADVCALMFSQDHYKERDFLSALTMFSDAFNDNEESSMEEMRLRFIDTNTSMLMKCLELLEELLKLMDESWHHLSEYEASCFLPFLVNKVCLWG
jgi:cytoskeleton-associated protein 5